MTFNTLFIFCVFFLNFTSVYLNKKSNLKRQAHDIMVNLSNYNYPKPNSSDDIVTIAILNTNDIHGAALREETKLGNETYSRAGVANLAPYIKALRKEFKNQFLWLDSGDQFSGTLESKLTNGKVMTEFYNIMKLDAATIGNHEFDKGTKYLNKRMNESQFPYITNNIAMKNGDSLNLKNVAKYKIFEISGVKIGVTGISTRYTPRTTSGDVSSYKFLKYKARVSKYSKILRDKGANFVILLAHAGTHCKSKVKGEDYEKNRLTTENNDIGKCFDQEILKLLKELPKNTVDAVYAGHVHSSVHSFINGIPVLQNNFHALTFNVGYFSFNKKTKEYIRDNTVIEGPVPVCSQIFSKSLDCKFFPKKLRVEEVLDKYGKLSEFYYHNMKIKPLKNVEKMIEKYSKLVQSAKNRVLFKLDVQMKRDTNNENPLANFVCDMLKNITDSHFCVFNQGAFRAIWEPGQITYYKYFEMFSLNTEIVTIKLTGKQIKRMMNLLNSGVKAFYATSGLTSYVRINPTKSLVKLTKSNGNKLDNDKVYTIVTNTFLVNGGDDFAVVVKEIPLEVENDYGEFKELTLGYLKKFPVVTKEMVIKKNRPSLIHVN